MKKNRTHNIDFVVPIPRTPMAIELLKKLAESLGGPCLAETWTPACHTVARAAMRKALGLGPTEIRAVGTGTSCSDEKVTRRHRLLILLAGLAWESQAGFRKLDLLTMMPEAFDEARQFLAQNPVLRLRNPPAGRHGRTNGARPRRKRYDTAQVALGKSLDRACRMLEPYGQAISAIGWRLQDEGAMSARQLSALLSMREVRLTH